MSPQNQIKNVLPGPLPPDLAQDLMNKAVTGTKIRLSSREMPTNLTLCL